MHINFYHSMAKTSNICGNDCSKFGKTEKNVFFDKQNCGFCELSALQKLFDGVDARKTSGRLLGISTYNGLILVGDKSSSRCVFGI